MLTGDTGIFTNAQKAKAANTEGEVIERMDIAYNSIKAAKIIDSNVDGATAKTLDALVTSVKNDLGMDATKDTDKGYTITTTPDADSTTTGTITIEYTDNTFKLTNDEAGIAAIKEGKEYPKITAVFTVTSSDVTYTTRPAKHVI